MISELFIDMDGCISDFHKRYEELYSIEPEVDYNTSNNKKQKLHRECFKRFVDDGNFATLDPMPDFQEGLEFLEWINKEHNIPVCFLTSTATEEYLNEISRQKREWLKKHNVRFNPVFVPGKRMKCYYAKENRILVDDTFSNIESWTLNHGIGIHHKSWKETINIIKTHL